MEDGIEKEMLAALHRLVPGMSADWATTAVLDFETYQNSAVQSGTLVDQATADLIQKSPNGPYNEKALADPANIKDPAVKKALQELSDRGYKVIIPEGNYQAVIDYRAYQGFEAFLPPDIAKYIEIMVRESDSRMLEDGGVIIPVDEVLARALACESFLKEFPASPRANKLKLAFNNYMNTLFFGANNTPAFDYTTNTLVQEFLDSYRKAASAASDSRLLGFVRDYLKVLEENKFTLTQAVTDFRKDTTDRLLLYPSYGCKFTSLPAVT